jgi:uroporphyrinogen-III synthase
VARERRLLSISRESYLDPRFKLFTDLPEDSYEAFLSAPILVRGQVAGVINVQHRNPHFHSGGEMELLTTVGEQVGSLVAMALLGREQWDTAKVVDLVMAAPARRG